MMRKRPFLPIAKVASSMQLIENLIKELLKWAQAKLSLKNQMKKWKKTIKMIKLKVENVGRF